MSLQSDRRTSAYISLYARVVYANETAFRSRINSAFLYKEISFREATAHRQFAKQAYKISLGYECPFD